MEQKSKIISILIIFLFVNMGGVLGLFLGNSLLFNDSNAQEEIVEIVEDVEEVKVEEKIQEKIQEEIQEEVVVIREEDVIKDRKRTTVEGAFGNWKNIIEYVNSKSISFDEGAKYIGEIASDRYLSFLPDGYTILRLNHIKKNPKKGILKEVKYENINYRDEKVAYVNVVEGYDSLSYAYVLKFVKEDGWNFAGQIELKEMAIEE
ncbi:MAG: hypothetical protein N4A57_14700 [Anaeromicrobium sp.]|jgi:urocanate hydratase|uniref:hypothetical protein n=1 Tax=Anaeromicrobium sp. TaxID=1929132 RepID=UPI0025ED2F32|nr:hypothetical protein [Anaeromicrobium sp.]MCT4595495.1 hypothetical protein [Anaeromicrobium sp.]